MFKKILIIRKYLLLGDPQPLHANDLKKRAELFCGQEYFLHLLELPLLIPENNGTIEQMEEEHFLCIWLSALKGHF